MIVIQQRDDATSAGSLIAGLLILGVGLTYIFSQSAPPHERTLILYIGVGLTGLLGIIGAWAMRKAGAWRRKWKAFAHALLNEYGRRTQAILTDVSEKTWVQQYGKDFARVCLLSVTYQFTDSSNTTREQQLQIEISLYYFPSTLLSNHDYWGPLLDASKEVPASFKTQTWPAYGQNVASGLQLDYYALWEQFRAFKKGDSLSIAYNFHHPEINYPEAYLQALDNLKG